MGYLCPLVIRESNPLAMNARKVDDSSSWVRSTVDTSNRFEPITLKKIAFFRKGPSWRAVYDWVMRATDLFIGRAHCSGYPMPVS